MKAVYKPKINASSSEDGYPYTDDFNLLFSTEQEALNYASSKLHEHSNHYSEPKASVETIEVYETVVEANDNENSVLHKDITEKIKPSNT